MEFWKDGSKHLAQPKLKTCFFNVPSHKTVQALFRKKAMEGRLKENNLPQ